MRTIALSNGLYFPENHHAIYSNLCGLKGLHGQFRSKGTMVNAPVNVDTYASSLPRNLDDNSTVHVHLARKTIYLRDYMQRFIKPDYMWTAVRYLQGIFLHIDHDIDIITRNLNQNNEGFKSTEINEGELDVLFEEKFSPGDDDE
ncbi:hypothetical protein A0J61_08957 [Choanephora cucurbitarum]|uniref:Uncharacterized protein n=1 Tax=Choanephora cucurbitarum TaxID=101091 RepID=A0A1C7N1W4_9FUNG|nr:hypothetical protein A0J61_08957 [Choanephora cucurbitarum]